MAKRSAIHDAAIAEFSRRGYASTSMANIAEAANMSRPALYQYFRNKGDVFTSAFVALLEDHRDRALAALEGPGSIVDQIDEFLQRWEGDLWEQLAASPHAEELMTAKGAQAATAVSATAIEVWSAVESYLKRTRPAVSKTQRSDWLDVLHFSPKGFKSDGPSVSDFRRRLATLARSVGAEIEREARAEPVN